MAFILPFEKEICALDDELAALPKDSPDHAETLARLADLERAVYPKLSAYDTFLLSGHPLRPKALDYTRYIFRDVRLAYNPDVRGDHLLIAGEAKLEIGRKLVDVIVIGQQTGPSSQRDELLQLPGAEYRRWNQGMSFPDSYRKAVYFMDIAEQRGWPVVVFVDTPGADPSEYSEEEGQAFAINAVIHKTTALRTPNLAYIISLGASGGAIAITPTNRTIMNQYATYMVISPGGCASILFRNRSPESIRKAADGLQLTSADALRQDTVDEVVPEGMHPGHRYPCELLAAGKDAVTRNVKEIMGLSGVAAEAARRARFFAQGVWGTTGEARSADKLAQLAAEQDQAFVKLRDTLGDYMVREGSKSATKRDEASINAEVEGRLHVARMIYAVARRDADYISKILGRDAKALSCTQWAQIREYVLERRYGDPASIDTPDYNGSGNNNQRLHPIDWIRRLTDEGTFREFEETITYCSVDQLQFPQYQEALERGIEKTGLHSGLITGSAKFGGHPVVLAINNFGLVGSSLCDEIGEKLRHAARQALELHTPLVTVALGGGARMQEGTPSMHRNIPKVQHALNELEEAGIPHISIIADPTLGGTAISYGLRGEYMIVVMGSMNIGFSGKRVVEQFQRRRVAADFQHETWLLRRGFVDETVDVDHLGGRIAELLEHVASGGQLAELQTRQLRRWEPKEEVILEPLSNEGESVKRPSRVKRRNCLNV
ncbi:MAG: carboxyl transferase domain-containing protein [Planctomycetota bacterium]